MDKSKKKLKKEKKKEKFTKTLENMKKEIVPISEETTQPKEEKEISYYDFGTFRICRPDPLNWAIDPAKEDGTGWKQGQRCYYSNLDSACIFLLEKMIGNAKGITKVKKLREEIQKAKEEILAGLKTVRTDKISS